MLIKSRQVIYLIGLCFIIGIFTGLIRNPAKSSLSSILDQCSEEKVRAKHISCVSTLLATSQSNQSTRELMTELSELAVSQKNFIDNPTFCHDVSHAIGQAGGKSNQINLGVSLAECTPICTAGCYHGVIEGHVSKVGEISEELMKVCDKSIFPDNSSHEACLHGLGHGIASINGNDLIKSLKMCDFIESDYRTHCGAGVLMELFEPGSFEHAKIPIPEDILSMCEPMWGEYKKLCLETSGTHELGRSGSLENAISMCKKIDPIYQEGCATAIGTHLFHDNDWSDAVYSNRCYEFKNKVLTIECIKGIISASNNSDPEKNVSKQLCKEYNFDLGQLCIN